MDKTLEQRVEELEKRVAELENKNQPASIYQGNDNQVVDDERDLKQSVRKILQLMEDEKVELAIYDEGELYFETRGKRSGHLIRVKFSDMIRAYLY